MRFRLKTNEIPRGASSPLELASETIKVTAKRNLKVTANGRVLIGD